MKRILTISAAIFCLCSCEKENITDTFETRIQKLYGEYALSDVHWTGLAVDLNDNYVAYWSLLHEFQDKIGYYEPDYTATVEDGIVFSGDEDWAESAAAFNVTLPYPHYTVSDGRWLCTDIRTLKVTLRATEDTFELFANCCWMLPGYTDAEDVFLSHIQDISLYVESYDDSSFKIGVHCTMPYDATNGSQTLNQNYLYYTFTR